METLVARDHQTVLVPPLSDTVPPQIHYHSRANLSKIPQLTRLSEDERFAMKVVSAVLPFKVNDYVIRHLIDWDSVPDDPIFRLTFPHRDMLAPEHYRAVADLLHHRAAVPELARTIQAIRRELNPHPAGQMAHNVPRLEGERLAGVQHKYRETVLFFPAHGQTCHSYCTFCFRWAQFVGIKSLRFQATSSDRLVRYLQRHPEVSDLLITGGDPMTMPARFLKMYIEPLLDAGLEHLHTIRIGTKSITYWPYRYLSDPDSDDLLRLFEKIVASGKHLAFMAHVNHPQELEPEPVRRAVRRIRATGAVIRCQSPLVRHVNDDPAVWSRLWRTQVRLGCIPYYMFVERDTGPRNYFEVPIIRAWKIFREAISGVSGLARTVRGPSMSATPGKVVVDGVCTVGGQRMLALRFLQARVPDWVNRPFYARYDERACWLDQLQPAQGESFFYESELAAMLRQEGTGSVGSTAHGA